MSRWFDADTVIARIAGQMSYEIEVETGNETDCVDLAEELLNDIPSIDIVRCKECKHKQQCQKAVEHITHEPTSVTIGYKSVEWCSYGVKEGADDE